MPPDRVTTELRADEIEWELAPLPAPNLLAMSDEDRLVCAVREAEAYRLLAQQAIHELHDLTVRHDRLSDAHHRLSEEYRALRARASLSLVRTPGDAT